AQRNSLLKLLSEGRARAVELEFWDRELVTEGAYIRRHRGALIEGLSRLARDIHSGLTGGEESLGLDYHPSPADPSAEAFAAALKQGRQRELALGMTFTGPHRDELRFMVNGADVGIYGSRGQQRTVALSLRLAEAAFLHQDRGQPPVLLLDDVLSVLDAQRRSQLLGSLAPFDQWLLTTTDLSQVAPSFVEPAALFRIQGGKVSPLPSGANLLGP
ncbi:MAG: DNA replication and repair protein RecF, partial [Chloroflexota bacterium]